MYKNIDLLVEDSQVKNYGSYNYRIQETKSPVTAKPKHETKHSFNKQKVGEVFVAKPEVVSETTSVVFNQQDINPTF